jgi:hypothetical protein
MPARNPSNFYQAITAQASFIQEVISEVFLIISRYQNLRPIKTPRQLATLFNKSLSRKYGIYFKPHPEPMNKYTILEATVIPVKNRIKIILYYDNALSKPLTDPDSAEKFKKTLRHFLEHELVHKEQITRQRLNKFCLVCEDICLLNTGQTDDQYTTYLSEPLEWAAHAKSIIRDLFDAGYTKEGILSLLRSISQIMSEFDDCMLTEYLLYFPVDGPVLRKIYSHMYRFLQQ